uniref:Deoxynucleoside kinase n=1 Tax=Mimivirus LCMiAC01 TaxID=2506608 RepID=A0A481YZN1_9VIRU|nr:MAG: deoxynucleoside kinase [Mimivirus LCMiAC01]
MIHKILASFEGNIAVGKTTFIQKIEQRIKIDPDFTNQKFGVDFIEEPVKIWSSIKNEKGDGLLKVFYDDMIRYSYLFQNTAYITRMNKIVKCLLRSKNKYIFTDRSLQCDKNVFAKMIHDDKKLNLIEWNAYNLWNNFYDDVFYGGKYNIIYLRCKPEIAFERKKKRNRPEEANLPLSYFKALHNYHEDWLINNVDKDKYNVLVLDCNKDFEDNMKNFDVIYMQFKSYLSSIKPYDFKKYLFRQDDVKRRR